MLPTEERRNRPHERRLESRMTVRNRRVLSAWTARHDNGWVTTVLETPSGTFAAWASPSEDAASVDYMEDSPEHAQIAALFALKRKSGHAECSPECSSWVMHTHELSFLTAEQ
jgi:hypothetical protein